MQIFIDSANLEEIKEVVSWGIIDGVTTNPSLMAKEKEDPIKIAKKICQLVKGPVSLEGIALDHKTMIKEAEELAKIAKNVVVKIPMTIDGIKTVKALAKKRIKTNITLVFSANQAILAAKAGASFVSPFIGRLDDIGQNGVNLIKEIKTIYKNYNFPTKIIAASIRNLEHVKQAALAGANIATIPYQVLKKMFEHHLTDKGIEIFKNAWKEKQKL